MNDTSSESTGAALPEIPPRASGSAVLCWARHTICDGKVVTYSTAFEGSGRFPESKEATGHFDVSASRNAVMVHRCTIRTDWELQAFKAAIELANRMHCELAKRAEGGPNMELSHGCARTTKDESKQ